MCMSVNRYVFRSEGIGRAISSVLSLIVVAKAKLREKMCRANAWKGVPEGSVWVAVASD